MAYIFVELSLRLSQIIDTNLVSNHFLFFFFEHVQNMNIITKEN